MGRVNSEAAALLVAGICRGKFWASPEETERWLKTEARQYAKEAKRRVLSLIQMARTADQKVLLMRRYIDGMSWEDAAEAAGKSRTWATNTHGEALLYIRLPDAVKKQ